MKMMEIFSQFEQDYHDVSDKSPTLCTERELLDVHNLTLAMVDRYFHAQWEL